MGLVTRDQKVLSCSWAQPLVLELGLGWGQRFRLLAATARFTGLNESGVAQFVSPQNPSGVRSGHSNCVALLGFLRARGRGVGPCGTALAHSRAVSVGTAERAVRELARKAGIK